MMETLKLAARVVIRIISCLHNSGIALNMRIYKHSLPALAFVGTICIVNGDDSDLTRKDALSEVNQISNCIVSYCMLEHFNLRDLPPGTYSPVRVDDKSKVKIEVMFDRLPSKYLDNDKLIVDPWKTPIKIIISGNHEISIISAGPDKSFEAADDNVFIGVTANNP